MGIFFIESKTSFFPVKAVKLILTELSIVGITPSTGVVFSLLTFGLPGNNIQQILI